MNPRTPSSKPTPKGFAALVLTVLLVAGLGGAPDILGDDRELLRQSSAEPFVYFLLDTSRSMALSIDGDWLEAGADDPRSRLYIARKVLYELLADVSGSIHFGFATLNQDQLRVRSKHWIYYPEDPGLNMSNQAPLASLQEVLRYPNHEPNNEIEIATVNTDGTRDISVDLNGDLMTFGRTFDTPAQTGDCAHPLDLGDSADRHRINRYSKLGESSVQSTRIWVKTATGSRVYRLTFENARPMDSTNRLGSETIDVTLKADKVHSCVAGVATFNSFDTIQETITLRKWREFLLTDDATGLSVTGEPKQGEAEKSGGLWDFRDAEDSFSCDLSKPHTGAGWEGNYDTGRPFSTNPVFEDVLSGGPTPHVDAHCAGSDCETLFSATTYDTSLDRRELDRGDMLPMHWSFSNKDELLSRINPNHLVDRGHPQFGSAVYFEDIPDATGRLQLKPQYRQSGEPPRYSPLVAAGVTPLADALLDFRCWYMESGGKSGGATCGRSPLASVYSRGFESLLQEKDPASFNCRQPIFIVISDVGSNCPGEAAVSDIAGMNSQTRKDSSNGKEPRSVGVSTWLFNLSTLSRPISNAGKGTQIQVANKQELRERLEEVLGSLEEVTSSFASAAVSPVQAGVEQKIYVTRFKPVRKAPVWEGSVLAFKKPLPLTKGQPDTSGANFLWDAATVLSTKQAPSSSTLSFPFTRSQLRISRGSENGRRLIVAIHDSDPTRDGDGSRRSDNDGILDNDEDLNVPRRRALFGPVESPTLSGLSPNQVRKDLWTGMGLVSGTFQFQAGDPFTNHRPLTEAAHDVFAKTYAVKEVLRADSTIAKYVMGDVFHASPLWVGSPGNSRFLARSGPGEAFEGYDKFFDVQARRRRILFAASNDGQLHAFDAGRFEGGSFNNGTGRELFAYTPRVVLPTLRSFARPNAEHQWGVDGTPVAADVKIDPVHAGKGVGISAAAGPKAGERQWRTVVLGGLRRGGRGYYALDVTRPDEMDPGADGWVPPNGSVVVPGCFETSGSPADEGDCDLDYPSILWEFTDPDLGQTWSTPDVGAVRVIENGIEAVKFVAIFGGGADPDGLLDAGEVRLGSYLYIVDIETGKMLYKRRVAGATPAAPAAVDTDQDGFLDRIYMGTTAGLMYRVDLTTPMPLRLGANCPATRPVVLPPAIQSTDRCCAEPAGPAYGCVTDPEWEPYVIFDTATDETVNGSTVSVSKPIFLRPTVVFVARLNNYALAFGTGNRDDLWAASPPGGNRLYVFVDDTDALDRLLDLPRTEADFEDMTGPPGLERDLLTEPGEGQRGYYIKLGVVPSRTTLDFKAELNNETVILNDVPVSDVTNEKLIAPPTAVAGLSLFSTFVPISPTADFNDEGEVERRCLRRGISRVYTSFTASGEPVCVGPTCTPPCEASDPTCSPRRCDPATDASCRKVEEVGNLVSEPFLDEAAAPCPGLEGMTEVLMKQLFPPTCNFAGYSWDLRAIRTDTGVECLARIPVCIVQKNWRD